MKDQTQRAAAFALLTATGLMYTMPHMMGQTRTDSTSQPGNVDFSGASTAGPFPVGTAMPPQCRVGETWFKPDAPGGQNLYLCTATNVWSQLPALTKDSPLLAVATLTGNNIFSGTTSYSTSSQQNLSPTSAIVCNATRVAVASATPVALSATPIIADAEHDGQICIVQNVGAHDITLTSGAGTNLKLPSPSVALKSGHHLVLIWNLATSLWTTDMSAQSGYQTVRDASGGSQPPRQTVKFLSGFTVGDDSANTTVALDTTKVATVASLQGGSWAYAVDSGSTDAYAACPSPPVSSLTDGMRILVRVNTSNTGAATLNLCTLGAKKILLNGAELTANGTIAAAGQYQLSYNTVADAGAGAWVLHTNGAPAAQKTVKDYGAAGDGVTQDHAAFKAAIAAVGAGGTIVIPPGTYLLDKTQMLDVSDRTIVAYGATLLDAYPYAGHSNGTRWYGGKIVQQDPSVFAQVFRIDNDNTQVHGLDFHLAGAYVAYLISWGENITINGGVIDKAPSGSAINITRGSKISLANLSIYGHAGGSDDTITTEGNVGEINGLAITNVVVFNSQAVLRVNPTMNYKIRNVSVSNVVGHNVSSVMHISPAANVVENVSVSNVNLTDDDGSWMYQIAYLDPTGTATIRNLTVDNVSFWGRVHCPGGASHQPVLIEQTSASAIENVRLSNITWLDRYNGAAAGDGNAGCPAPNFLSYTSSGGGTLAGLHLNGINARGFSGSGIYANAAITRFTVSDSHFADVLTTSASGNIVDVAGSVAFSGVTFSDLSAKKLYKGVTMAGATDYRARWCTAANTDYCDWESFLSGSGENRSVGALRWQMSSGQLPTFLAPENVPEGNGIVRSDTGTASGTQLYLQPQTTARAGFHSDSRYDIICAIRLSDGNAADSIVRIGLNGHAAVGGGQPSDGVYIEKNGAMPSGWEAVARSNGIESRVATGVAIDTGVQWIRVRRVDASSVGFSVNSTFTGALAATGEVTRTTPLPRVGLNGPWLAIQNTTATSRKMDVLACGMAVRQ